MIGRVINAEHGVFGSRSERLQCLGTRIVTLSRFRHREQQIEVYRSVWR